MAIILKGSKSASIDSTYKLQPKQPGVELLDNGYCRLKIGSTTNLDNPTDDTSWIQWSALPYAAPSTQIYQDTKISFPTSEITSASIGLLNFDTDIYSSGTTYGSDYITQTLQSYQWIFSSYGAFYPNTTGTQSLGTSTNRWSRVYTSAVANSAGDLTLNSTDGSNNILAVCSSLYPTGSNSTLGISANPWSHLYTDHVTSTTSNMFLSTSNVFNNSSRLDVLLNINGSLSSGVTVDLNTSYNSISLKPYKDIYDENTVWTLGSVTADADLQWDNVYSKEFTSGEMSIKYNSTNETIEFLAIA